MKCKSLVILLGVLIGLSPSLAIGGDDFYVIPVRMGSDHDHWGQSWSGGGVGLILDSSNNDALRVSGAYDGVYVNSAGDDGVTVFSAGDDGVFVRSAGSPSSMTFSTRKNGFEVAGAQGHGLYVGRADGHGVYVPSAGYDGVSVGEVGFNGVKVHSAGYDGVYVRSAGYDGVEVYSAGSPSSTTFSTLKNGFEVAGAQGHGLYVGRADEDGVHVDSAGGFAGYFDGDVQVTGNLSKGSGSFKIDHPLDPENKYLYHSFVESPDMKNIYDGTVTLDEDGEAWVELPEWFEALSRDFRYQLTPIGAPMPNLYIAREIEGNRFQIAEGEPGKKVSWQVTGIRHDPYAQANRILVEEDKPAEELGTYLHPEAYGMPETKGLAYKKAQEHLARQEARKKGGL